MAREARQAKSRFLATASHDLRQPLQTLALVQGLLTKNVETDKAKKLGFLGELAAANPLGRAAEPEEIAQWVVMMVSSRNTYATGENVVVSGGYIYV